MKSNKLEELFERLELECKSYKDDIIKKSSNEVFKASGKTFFVVNLESYVQDEDNIEYLEDKDVVLSNIESITLDDLFQYYNESEGSHFDTYGSLVDLIEGYCAKEEWHLERGKAFAKSIWK